MKKLLLSALVLTCFGCASMFSGTNDRVSVNSMDEQSVLFVDGVARGKGSISLDVERGKKHDFTAKKEGCQDVTLSSTDRFNAVTLLNVFWGWGMLLAFPIDFVTGAAWKVDPTSYTVTPICPVTTNTTAPKATPAPAVTPTPATPATITN